MGKLKDQSNMAFAFYRNMPVKKALILLIIVMVFVTLIFTASTILIIRPYRDSLPFDQRDIMDFLLYLIISAYSITFIITGVFIFYKLKLEKPIKLIVDSTKRISANDLDFELLYPAKDEMGLLCSAFEKMRKELYDNNINMWHMAEERRKVNAAFAHDLRTPVTVLNGYTDFLFDYISSGKSNSEKLLSMVATMSGHITRIKNYVEMMSTIQKLEDTPVHTALVEVTTVSEKIAETVSQLALLYKKDIVVNDKTEGVHISIDTDIVYRIVENITLNACQHAKNRVTIEFENKNNMLSFVVTDDGQGFDSVALEQAFMAFNDVNKYGSLGMGLHICQVLSKKHGGSIMIENLSPSGAKISFCFALGK